MARKVFAALLLGLVCLSPSVAADWPLDTVAPLVTTLRASADTLGGSATSFADNTVALVEDSAGPGSAFVAAVLAAAGPLGSMGSQLQEEFVALGDGRVTVQNGTNLGACSAMHALVEYHEPYFSETSLYFDFHGGQGTPAGVCASGWRGALGAEEVQGDLSQGLVGKSRSIDAWIDLWVGPVRADGTRAFWVRQVTFPSGIGDVLEFTGSVVEVV